MPEFPIKLDDQRTLRGVDANRQHVTFDDYLYEGDEVGIGEIPENEEDRDPRPPYGNVVRKADGLWIVARTEEEERQKLDAILAATQPQQSTGVDGGER